MNNVIRFELDPEQFENACYKNRCLQQIEMQYIVMYLKNTITDEQLQDFLQEAGVIAFAADGQYRVLNYPEVLELEAVPIIGLGFPSEFLRKSGSFNERLQVETNFELLCRLTETAGKCTVYPVGNSTVENRYDEASAYTFAYMIRYHMNSLHKAGKLEEVFQTYCSLMQQQGIFPCFQQYINRFMNEETLYESIARSTAPFMVLRGDDTCWGMLQDFADQLAEKLAVCGQAVIVVGGEATEYENLQNKVYKGIVGFQAKALEIDFFRKLHGPKFQFWFDYPLHFTGILRNLSEDYYVLCQDADYARLIRDYYHSHNAVQFPPAGIENPGIYRKDRPYDIVFVGSYFADEGALLAGEERRFYDYMREHPLLTFEQGLTELWHEDTEEMEESIFIQKMLSMKRACRCVIGYYRNAVIDIILNAGFVLHVYGDSWNAYQGKGKGNLVIHPQVTVEESLEELSKSKIGLNVMSWHKAGMTERVANIMLSGAVCLTEETAYLREHMTEGQELVFFDLARLEELPAIISGILADDNRREEIVKKAYQRAMAEHTWHCRARQLIELAENGTEQSTIAVFVATHVPFDPPNNPIYIPLHVGRSGKRDLGYVGDDTGENISDLNFLYGELTGLFWIWQNIRDLDYAGLCHYRRYFINGQRREMRKEEYIELLKQYDAIVPNHAECESSYYEHFGKAHDCRNLDAVERAIKKLYPEYLEAYDYAMKGNIYYGGNLMVTSLPVLKAYAEWLFSIFAEAGEEIDVRGYDDYHKRIYGFLSEQMFYVFLLANGLTFCEVPVGISTKKAETKAL